MSQFFNVDSFKSALRGGGARPNQFEIIIGNPTGVPGVNFTTDTPYLISVAELPGQTINPAVVQYRGREVKFAGDRVYSPWTMTALNDTGFTLRNNIEAWMNGMDDRQLKIGNTEATQYQATINIYQRDRNGNTLKWYVLAGAFPVDLSPVALDYGANDTVSTFTCTWQYQSFFVNQ